MATRIHDPAVRTGVAGAGSAVPRDLTRVVDRDGLTERSPKGAEVPQPPLGPNEGVAHRSATAATRRTRCDGAEPGHLPSDVHGNRLAQRLFPIPISAGSFAESVYTSRSCPVAWPAAPAFASDHAWNMRTAQRS